MIIRDAQLGCIGFSVWSLFYGVLSNGRSISLSASLAGIGFAILAAALGALRPRP